MKNTFFKIITAVTVCFSVIAVTPFKSAAVMYGHPGASFVLEDPGTWRGVNLPLFVHKSDEKNLSQAEFDYAAEAGANIIRLCVFADPKYRRFSKFTDENNKVLNENPGLEDISVAVEMAHKAGLKVIVDMHTMPGATDGEIWGKAEYWETLRTLWKRVAEKFKGNPTVVAYDLMNEPNITVYLKDAGVNRSMFQGAWSPPSDWKDSPRDYNSQMKNIMEDIRDVDADRWLIIEGFGMLGNPVNYNWMKPINLSDKHVIYSFHMYVPTNLTNIGVKEFKERNLVGEAFDKSSDTRKIDNALAPVLAFQKKYKVPIFVGEFGVTNDAIFNSDANGHPYNGACWLNVVVNKFNEYKWGWTFWDFWVDIRKPKSKEDPRYLILNKAFTGEMVDGYCK